MLRIVGRNQTEIGIVAPVYNEAAGIKQVVNSWVKVLEKGVQNASWKDYEIVLCDDGSSDETPLLLRSLANLNPHIKLIQNESNMGAGASLDRAIKNSRSKYLVLMDSDGQFEPTQIFGMFKNIGAFDAVCGMRSKKSSLIHRIASSASTKYSNTLLGTNVPDFNCQLKIVPGDFLRSTNLRSTRMNYSGEITFLVQRSTLSSFWMEIEHLKRNTGKSNSKIVKDGLARFLFISYLGLETMLVEKKIIMPQIGTWKGKRE